MSGYPLQMSVISNKEFKMVSKSWFQSELSGGSEDRRFFHGKRCVSAVQIFPRFIRQFQVLKCQCGLREHRQPFRFQLDSTYTFYQRIGVFSPPTELSVTLCVSIIGRNILFYKSAPTLSYVKPIHEIPQNQGLLTFHNVYLPYSAVASIFLACVSCR